MPVFTPTKTVQFVVEENDGGMLLDLNSGRFYGLSPTAARIWKDLTAGISPDEIAEVLSAEVGADLGIVSADVDRLVAGLADRGLIRQKGESP